MIDHAQEMIDRLLAQFAGKPKFDGLLRVLGNRLNTIEQVLDDLQDKRWIDTAEGVQLDGCGVIVDQSRLIDKAIALPFFGFAEQTSGRGFGQARFRLANESYLSSALLADPEYRKVIKSKVTKNVSLGLSEEVISSYQMIFDAPKVIITELDNATMRIGIARRLSETEIVFTQAVNLFVKPGGVGVQLRTHFDADNTFGFAEQGMKGFGQGSLAKTF